MGHQIDNDEVEHFETSYVLASVFGRGENKKLIVTTTKHGVMYAVENKREVTLRTASLEDAVNEYNSR